MTARFKGHVKNKGGKGHFKDVSKEIDMTVGYHESKKSEPLSSSTKLASPELIKLCGKCLQEIGKGKQHICNNLKNNAMKIIGKLSEKTQEQVMSCIMKNKLVADSDVKEKLENVDISVSTGGRKKRITINPSVHKEVVFDEESLDNLRVKLGHSGSQMKKVTNYLRCHVGRKCIPVNYFKHMTEVSNSLKNVYKAGSFEFECSAKKEVRPVVYADAEELLDEVIIKRNLQGNVTVKAMADGGQGFFKISLTILPENYSPIENSSTQEASDDENHQHNSEDFNGPKKRKSYEEGGSISKKGKLTSVDSLILLCITPDIKETHANMKILFELTNINKIPFKFVADFKLLLIVNGQQTATSAYPCPYCFVSLHDLRGTSASDSSCSNINSDNELEIENHSELKTYGNLRTDYEKYCLTGYDKKKSKECHSTINLPLFDESDDTCVLQKCVIPELHVLQGFVNHLFWKGLVPLLGKDKALIWPKKLNLISKSYHGDAFEGNACRTLLKNADMLDDPTFYEEVGIVEIMPYITAYKAMNKVVNCCFTSGKVGPSLDAYIKELEYALNGIDKLSETLKIHVILSHVKESLQFIEKNNGLGFWSEQSGESIHHEFLKFWARYKVSSIHHAAYLSNFLKAVIEFSSLHL